MKHSHAGKIILNESVIAEGVNLVADRLNSDFSDAVVITVTPGYILHR